MPKLTKMLLELRSIREEGERELREEVPRMRREAGGRWGEAAAEAGNAAERYLKPQFFLNWKMNETLFVLLLVNVLMVFLLPSTSVLACCQYFFLLIDVFLGSVCQWCR